MSTMNEQTKESQVTQSTPIQIFTTSIAMVRRTTPHLAEELAKKGIVEVIKLGSGIESAQVYIYKTGTTRLIYGSRALFTRWLRTR